MLALPILLTACWETDPEAIEVEQDRLVAPMERHDIQARAITRAVVDGDLAAARKSAAALADRLPLPGVPERLDPHQRVLRAAATDVAAALDMASAARGVGELAVACGSCHNAVGVSAPPAADMPDGEEWEAAMARHRWAADEMWTSLVWMAPDRYERVVRAWNEIPLARPHTEDEKRFTAEVLRLEDRVHNLAARGISADAHARADIYGQMLATCAACHAQVRDP
jgi:cytochrome c553